MRRIDQRGFSLVEAIIGGAILLVSALAVAFMLKGKTHRDVGELKACQEINEEIFSQIASLGYDSFSHIYDTDNGTHTARHCPASVCGTPELGMTYAQRWMASEGASKNLTEANNPPFRPVVRPYLLRHSSINYLNSLYNGVEAFCATNEMAMGVAIPVNSTFMRSLTTDRRYEYFFSDRSEGAGDSGRYVDTRMLIRPMNARTGEKLNSCPRPLHLRPPSQLHGEGSLALDAGLIQQGEGRADLGFAVQLTTTYLDRSMGGASPVQRRCVSERQFFYSPEPARGRVIASDEPPPTTTLNCGDPSDELNFSFNITKNRPDSVLLCRDRSVAGTFSINECNPGGGPNCSCSGYGCPNVHPDIPTADPFDLVAPNQWFACDLLSQSWSFSGMGSVNLDFSPGVPNGGSYRFSGSLNAPHRAVVDVAEVDASLHMGESVDSVETVEFENRGRSPGAVCGPCNGEMVFACPDCSVIDPCDCSETYDPCICDGICPCDSTVECCPGDTYPTNAFCLCDSSTTCCPGDSYPSNPNCSATPPPPPTSCDSRGPCLSGGFGGCSALHFPYTEERSDTSCTAPFIRCWYTGPPPCP